MATTLQLRRYNTATIAGTTGADGEVFVDTTKKTLVVQDGSTAGGTPLATETFVTSALASLQTTVSAALINYVTNTNLTSTLTAYPTNANLTSTVSTAISNLVGGAPAILDTLGEIATALGNNSSLAVTLTSSIALKATSSDLSYLAWTSVVSTLQSSGYTLTLSSNGALIPGSNNMDLGTSSAPFRSLYISNNTFYFGSSAVQILPAGQLQITTGSSSSTLINTDNLNTATSAVQSNIAVLVYSQTSSVASSLNVLIYSQQTSLTTLVYSQASSVTQVVNDAVSSISTGSQQLDQINLGGTTFSSDGTHIIMPAVTIGGGVSISNEGVFNPQKATAVEDSTSVTFSAGNSYYGPFYSTTSTLPKITLNLEYTTSFTGLYNQTVNAGDVYPSAYDPNNASSITYLAQIATARANLDINGFVTGITILTPGLPLGDKNFGYSDVTIKQPVIPYNQALPQWDQEKGYATLKYNITNHTFSDSFGTSVTSGTNTILDTISLGETSSGLIGTALTTQTSNTQAAVSWTTGVVYTATFSDRNSSLLSINYILSSNTTSVNLNLISINNAGPVWLPRASQLLNSSLSNTVYAGNQLNFSISPNSPSTLDLGQPDIFTSVFVTSQGTSVSVNNGRINFSMSAITPATEQYTHFVIKSEELKTGNQSFDELRVKRLTLSEGGITFPDGSVQSSAKETGQINLSSPLQSNGYGGYKLIIDFNYEQQYTNLSTSITQFEFINLPISSQASCVTVFLTNTNPSSTCTITKSGVYTSKGQGFDIDYTYGAINVITFIHSIGQVYGFTNGKDMKIGF